MKYQLFANCEFANEFCQTHHDDMREIHNTDMTAKCEKGLQNQTPFDFSCLVGFVTAFPKRILHPSQDLN